MRLLTYLIINSIAVFISGYILSGVHLADFLTAVIVAIVLGVLNTFIKPILLFLTLPITVITLGLFAIVINAVLILLTTYLVPGFTVDGFWWALLFAIVLSLISSFLNSLSTSR